MRNAGLLLILTVVVLATSAASMLPAADAQHSMAAGQSIVAASVVAQVSKARLATAKYATNLARAKADGYMIITPMIPNMGYHFLNPKISGFDVTRPPMLVYIRDGQGWQLVAIEWVYGSKPASPPFAGATYGDFGAACHYKDGEFVMAAAEAQCAKTNPKTGSGFNFWHGPLVTLHAWIWYPNPSGLFASFNPLLTPYNRY
jgi:hypothetical protein